MQASERSRFTCTHHMIIFTAGTYDQTPWRCPSLSPGHSGAKDWVNQFHKRYDVGHECSISNEIQWREKTCHQDWHRVISDVRNPVTIQNS